MYFSWESGVLTLICVRRACSFKFRANTKQFRNLPQMKSKYLKYLANYKSLNAHTQNLSGKNEIAVSLLNTEARII